MQPEIFIGDEKSATARLLFKAMIADFKHTTSVFTIKSENIIRIEHVWQSEHYEIVASSKVSKYDAVSIMENIHPENLIGDDTEAINYERFDLDELSDLVEDDISKFLPHVEYWEYDVIEC